MGYGVSATTLREIASELYGSASHGHPDESLDDELEVLGDRIVIMAGNIHAGTYEFLVLIACFDRLRGWEPGGHRSCACWLAFRTGLDAGTAREHVRVARALEELPKVSEAMSSGALSFSQTRALTRVAKPDTESDLLELAVGCTTAQLERVVRAYKMGTRRDEADRELERHESRTLSIFPDYDGMYVVKGRVDPEVGAVLMRAIDAASDSLYRERTDAYRPDSDRQAARRRADALGLLAERALAAGFNAGKAGDEAAPDAPREPGDNISGTRAERYQVVLHVEPETLAAEGDPGQSELEDGTRVSAETSRRLSCDAGLVRVTHDSEGSVLDVGRRTRTISPALRRALEVRDRGCRFPGCGLRYTDAHHVVHWADGGETSLANTVLLCRYHHRLVHEGGWDVESWGSGRAVFTDPGGSVHYDAGWYQDDRREPASAKALVASNRRRGVEPDGLTASARWKREADIPFDVLCRASEAALN